MTKKNENLALAKSESALPSTDVRKDWGAAENVDQGDLLIPKIYHQQALSKFVQDGNAQPGDWCDSLSGVVLAKRDQPLEVIIFWSYKKLLINLWNPSSGKYDWLRSEDLTEENSILPWEEETEEGKIKRQKQYNFFCLLAGKPEEIPSVLSLMSTKIKAAQKLSTMFGKLARIGLPSAAFVFELHSKKETGEKGSWYGVEIVQGRKTTPAEQDLAYEWYQKVKSQRVVVAESSDTDGETNFNDVENY